MGRLFPLVCLLQKIVHVLQPLQHIVPHWSSTLYLGSYIFSGVYNCCSLLQCTCTRVWLLLPAPCMHLMKALEHSSCSAITVVASKVIFFVITLFPPSPEALDSSPSIVHFQPPHMWMSITVVGWSMAAPLQWRELKGRRAIWGISLPADAPGRRAGTTAVQVVFWRSNYCSGSSTM